MADYLWTSPEEAESLAWWQGAPPAWSPADAELVAWLQARAPELPREPFGLGPGRWVSDPDRFYAALLTEIAAGPGTPRARNGSLIEDLERLRALFDVRS